MKTKKKPNDTPNKNSKQRKSNESGPKGVGGHKYPSGPNKPHGTGGCGYGKGAKIK